MIADRGRAVGGGFSALAASPSSAVKAPMPQASRWRWAVAVSLTVFLGGCSDPTTPEVEIRAVITQAEEAAESRDLGDIRPLIADEYSDKRGYDKDQIQDLLRLLFLTHQSIHLLVHIESVDLPSTDVANVVALVGMADTADTLPDVDLYQFEVQLIDQGDGEWQVVNADWRRGLGNPPGR